MSRIHFTRAGGILGRDIDADIELNEIPEEESRELLRLIAETNFFNIPQNLIGAATPDEYEYTVTVETGDTRHTIHTSDTSAPESLRPLLDKLSRLAREGRADSPDI